MGSDDMFGKPVFVDAGTTVSKAVSRMLEAGSHEAFVRDPATGSFAGVLPAGGMARTSIADPDKTRIDSYMIKVNPLHHAEDPKDMLSSLLVYNFRSFPVEKGGSVFMVTKLSLLGALAKGIDFAGKKVDDVMSFPASMGPSDSISTARALMRDSGSQAVVVVDAKDRPDGIVDDLVMLKTVIERQRTKRGEEAGEKIRFDGITAASVVSQDFARVPIGTPLEEAVGRMVSERRHYLIVEDGGKLAGMITPKDVLKLVAKPVEGVHIMLSGMQEEDGFLMSVVNEEIERTVKKLGKMIPLTHLIMRLRKYSEDGGRIKYSIHARLITVEGAFFAQDYAWDLTEAIKGVLSVFEKEVIKAKTRKKTYSRRAEEES